jgi:hypothetical protein
MSELSDFRTDDRPLSIAAAIAPLAPNPLHSRENNMFETVLTSVITGYFGLLVASFVLRGQSPHGLNE